jgi:two-component system, cell cycle response regulator
VKILIAEDDAVSRTILRRAVEKFGHECLAAEDGKEAWELYRETPEVGAIISDWMMPGMDGLELCRKVRGEAEPRGYTYFIFLTALGDREHLRMGLEAGADDYLSKPLDASPSCTGASPSRTSSSRSSTASCSSSRGRTR